VAKLQQDMLEAAAMEETEDYIKRGRRFESVSTDSLKARWLVALREWLQRHDRNYLLEMDDSGAELRLRDINPPYDQLPPDIILELQRIHPDEKAVESAMAQYKRFVLKELSRKKPGH
jgi:hypothetical protein